MTAARRLIALAAFAALHVTPLQAAEEISDLPKLKSEVTVTTDLVRIGDILSNAGPAASIAIYRAPDPGTSGSLPIANVLNALRAHQVIGIETRGLTAIKVARAGRTMPATDLETIVTQALAQRMNVNDPASLAITYDREVQPLQLDTTYAGAPSPIAVRVDPRGRFDVTLEFAGDGSVTPIRTRYTGSAVDTVDAVVLLRTVERGETIKVSDVSVERRPRAEAGADAVAKDGAAGMQARRQVRAGIPVRNADLVKPDLVQRDQAVTLIYQTAGIYLTGSGKALENGTEGDVVTVMNLNSKRTITGTVTGRGQVTITAVAPRPAPTTVSSAAPAASVALAAATVPTSQPAE